MSGWVPPGGPDGGAGPQTYWQRAPEQDPLRPGALIRRGWRLFRSRTGPFLAVAAAPQILAILLALPSIIVVGRMIEAMATVLADWFTWAMANPGAVRAADEAALQAELEARIQTELQSAPVPLTEASLVLAVLGAIALAVSIVGTAALTAAALAAARGTRISIADAFGAALSRGSIVRPTLALAAASFVSSVVPTLLAGSPDFQQWAGEPGSPRSLLLGSLFSVAAIVLLVGIVILAVRWALYLPAVLSEPLGVGPGLARAADLSRGLRIRFFLVMVGVWALQFLIVGLLAIFVGIVVGVAAESIWAGYTAYVVAGVLGGLVLAPLLPAAFTVAYLDRTRDPGQAGQAGPAGGAPAP